MIDPVPLQTVARAAALFCAAAYVYAFVVRSRGDRRWHTVSLLCTGLALAGLSAIIPLAPSSAAPAVTMTLVFMIASVVTQATAAFRGRGSDSRRDRRASDSAQNRRASDRAPADQASAQL